MSTQAKDNIIKYLENKGRKKLAGLDPDHVHEIMKRPIDSLSDECIPDDIQQDLRQLPALFGEDLDNWLAALPSNKGERSTMIIASLISSNPAETKQYKGVVFKKVDHAMERICEKAIELLLDTEGCPQSWVVNALGSANYNKACKLLRDSGESMAQAERFIGVGLVESCMLSFNPYISDRQLEAISRAPADKEERETIISYYLGRATEKVDIGSVLRNWYGVENVVERAGLITSSFDANRKIVDCVRTNLAVMQKQYDLSTKDCSQVIEHAANTLRQNNPKLIISHFENKHAAVLAKAIQTKCKEINKKHQFEDMEQKSSLLLASMPREATILSEIIGTETNVPTPKLSLMATLKNVWSGFMNSVRGLFLTNDSKKQFAQQKEVPSKKTGTGYADIANGLGGARAEKLELKNNAKPSHKRRNSTNSNTTNRSNSSSSADTDTSSEEGSVHYSLGSNSL